MHFQKLRAREDRMYETHFTISVFMDGNDMVCQLHDKKRPRTACAEVVNRISPELMEERGFDELDPAYPIIVKNSIDALLRTWFQHQAKTSNPKDY